MDDQNTFSLVKHNDFWFPDPLLQPVLWCQQHFQAQNTDIFVSTMPKSGTTWSKALVFSIVNRHSFPIHQSPLLTSNPHSLVSSLEFDIYRRHQHPDLSNIPSPRIFSTHIPYTMLPASVVESESRIIYICRNPLDQFVSNHCFSLENKFIKEDDLDKDFDMFCRGIHSMGPIWDHMLGYWNASPQKVLFLKYEDLKEDIVSQLKKMAEFLGIPFTKEEEEGGVIEQISELCSFRKMSNLKVNRSGSLGEGFVPIKKKSLFRKGEVGDWANYVSPAMAERFRSVMSSKLEGTGLTFQI